MFLKKYSIWLQSVALSSKSNDNQHYRMVVHFIKICNNYIMVSDIIKIFHEYDFTSALARVHFLWYKCKYFNISDTNL